MSAAAVAELDSDELRRPEREPSEVRRGPALRAVLCRVRSLPDGLSADASSEARVGDDTRGGGERRTAALLGGEREPAFLRMPVVAKSAVAHRMDLNRLALGLPALSWGTVDCGRHKTVFGHCEAVDCGVWRDG